MGFIEYRLCEISQRYAHVIKDILVLSITDEMLKIVFLLSDHTTLRVSERWVDMVLVRYSYYWLNSENRLKVGWDNAPHHRRLENYPHHKHVGMQLYRVASYETSLVDVMRIIEETIQSP